MVVDHWQTLIQTLPEQSKSPNRRRKVRIACGQCGKPMNLRGYRYYCTDSDCDGKHGAHPNGKPLGIPTDQITGKARNKAHKEFDLLWKSGKVSRVQAYVILKRIMGMTKEEAHIGRFNRDQCLFLINQLKKLGDKVFLPPYNVKGFLQGHTIKKEES